MMEKQIVRQLQKSGNGMSVRVPPKVCEAIQADKGDNLLFEFEPDSGVVKLSKVVKPNPGSDDVLDETHRISEFKSRADEVVKKSQSQQTEISKFGFCSSCGSENIEVTGNRYYCGDCDVTYEVTPKGTIPIETNPSKAVKAVNDINNRIDELELDVDELMNNNPGEDEYSDGFLQFAIVPAGADKSTDADEETEQDGFITW